MMFYAEQLGQYWALEPMLFWQTGTRLLQQQVVYPFLLLECIQLKGQQE